MSFVWLTFPSMVSVFRDFIFNVIHVSTEKQMLWINTRRIVALMENVKAFLNLSFEKFIRITMDLQRTVFNVPGRYKSVSFFSLSTRPIPTPSYAIDFVMIIKIWLKITGDIKMFRINTLKISTHVIDSLFGKKSVMDEKTKTMRPIRMSFVENGVFCPKPTIVFSSLNKTVIKSFKAIHNNLINCYAQYNNLRGDSQGVYYG